MPSQKVYFSIPPLNDQSVQSSTGAVLSGGFSPKNGNSYVKFALSSQDRMLPTDEMYLTGRICMVNSDGTPLTPMENGGTASITTPHYGANNGANLTQMANQNISNWNGLESVVKKIFITSKKTSVNISEIRNYPMYNAVRKAYQNNEDDYLISPMIRASAGGTKAGFLNRHIATMDNCGTGASGQVSNVSSLNDEAYGQPFSFHLDTALLNNSQPLMLGQNYLGGIEVHMELNNENGVFSDRFRDTGSGQTACDNDGSYYILKDLRLQGRLLVPTPQDLQMYQDNFVLNDNFNLINDVNSSVNNSKYTPNVSMVRSVVNLFLDNDQENNRSFNQTNFRNPCGLVDYQQNKNNIRQPQDFKIEVVPNQLDTATYAGGTLAPKDISNKASTMGDAEVRNFFQRAVLNGELAAKTVAGLKLTADSLDEDYADRTTDGTGATDGVGLQTACDALGVGLDYTHNMGLTSNFSGAADYDLLMKSGVNSADSELPISRRSKSEIQQSYIKNVSAFNSTTLVKQM